MCFSKEKRKNLLRVFCLLFLNCLQYLFISTSSWVGVLSLSRLLNKAELAYHLVPCVTSVIRQWTLFIGYAFLSCPMWF